ncbi:MAG: hypothetical protein L0211_16920 [Planctomycetaceae bacterium]|nr:hypothetical protein [Planctomycetaceae bacterium]
MPGFNNGISFIYAVNSIFSQDTQNHARGTLNWIKDAGRDNDQLQFEGPKVVGSGWQRPEGSRLAFSGRGGIIYSIMADGTLKRYIHLGVIDGAARWVDGTGSNPIAANFGRFKHVFGGFEHVIYAVEQDGTLRWFIDRDGTAAALEGGQAVGSRFDRPSNVFAGDFNAIYTVEGDTLFHRQHLGMEDGTDRWTEKKPISTRITACTPTPIVDCFTHSWDAFKKVFTPAPMAAPTNSSQGGYIYMVTPEAELWRFRHFGWRSGSTDTRGPDSLGKAPRALGESWHTVEQVFAARI